MLTISHGPAGRRRPTLEAGANPLSMTQTAPSTPAGQRRRSRRFLLLVAATFGCAAAVAYQIYHVVCTEQTMASRTLYAHAAFGASELSREIRRELEGSVQRTLLPLGTLFAATRHAPGPEAVLAALHTPDERGSCLDLLAPHLAFRLEPQSGRLHVVPGAAADSAAWRRAADSLGRRHAWIAGVVQEDIARRRAVGQATLGVRTLVADGMLLAYVGVPAADGSVRLAYGLAADADATARAIAEHVVSSHALLPVAPEGAVSNAALVLSVRGSGGLPVFATAGLPYRKMSVEAALGGPLLGYTVRAGVAPDYATRLASVAWTWNRAQLVIALLTLTAGFIVVTLWQLQRERAMARLRSDFVSSVSHELRTPLAQIRMFAEMLRLGWVRSEEERARSVAIIDQEARRLTHLVENVLQFSRSERGAQRLAPERLALAPLAREVLDCFALIARTRGARLRLAVPDGLAARADGDALRQMLLNLLDNAVKYGPEGQTVTLGATAAGERVHVWVEDEGPGIPVRDRRRIWEPFQRLERDVGIGITGNGIGLSVVRDLVRAHGGAAWVEDGAGRAPARGARVVLAFEVPAAVGDVRAEEWSTAPEHLPAGA